MATLTGVPGVPSSSHVAGDRPCHRCGYSLRGLAYGGRCPECGTPIRRSFGRGTDSLVDAPLEYLRPLAAGLLLMAVCAIAGAFALGSARVPPALQASAWAVAICGAWWIGVWIATRPRPIGDSTIPDTLLESPGLRGAIRLLQLAWVGAAIGWAVTAYVPALTGPAVPPLGPAPGVPPPPPAAVVTARRAALILEGIGYLSVVPLSIYLSALAAWAGETGLVERFRWSAWGVTVGGIGGLAVTAAGALGLSLSPLVFGTAAVLLGVAVVGQVLFAVSLGQLAYSAIWAISNAHEKQMAEDRSARRRERDREEMAERTAAAARAMDSGRPAPSAPGPANQPILDRPRGGAEPYRLEPEQ